MDPIVGSAMGMLATAVTAGGRWLWNTSVTQKAHGQELTTLKEALEQDRVEWKERLDRVENKLDNVVDILLRKKQ